MKNNKKGFTLVELLAVIVILALIMGIAVVSIGGVLSTSRSKTFQESAASAINGLRQRLLIDNGGANSGSYYITKGLLEKGGDSSPYGGTYNWAESGEGKQCASGDYCQITTNIPDGCTATTPAFVTISNEGYKICLSDGTHFVFDLENKLLGGNATIN